MKNATVSAIVLSCLLWLVSIPAAGAEIRTWTDSTGRLTVKAEFVTYRDGIVYLHRQDIGKVIQVPIDRLSKADRDFVAAQKKPETVPPVGGADERPAEKQVDFRDALCVVKRTWTREGKEPTDMDWQHAYGILVTRDARGGIVVCDAEVLSIHSLLSGGLPPPDGAEFEVTLAAGSSHPRQTEATLVGIFSGAAVLRAEINKGDRTLDSFPGVETVSEGMSVAMHSCMCRYSDRYRTKTLMSYFTGEGRVTGASPGGTAGWTVVATTPSDSRRSGPAIITAGAKVAGLTLARGRFVSYRDLTGRLFPMVGSVRLHPTRWGPEGVEFDILADVIDPIGAAVELELLFGRMPGSDEKKRLSKLGPVGKMMMEGLKTKAALPENLEPAKIAIPAFDGGLFVYREDTMRKVGSWTWKDAFGPQGELKQSHPIDAGFISRLRWTTADGKTDVSDPIHVEVNLFRNEQDQQAGRQSVLVDLYQVAGLPQRFHRDGGLLVTSPADYPLTEQPLTEKPVPSQANSVRLVTEKQSEGGLDVNHFRQLDPENGEPDDWRVPTVDRMAVSGDGQKLFILYEDPLILREIDLSDLDKPVETRQLDLDQFGPAVKSFSGRGVETRYGDSLHLTSDFLVAIITAGQRNAKQVSSQMILIDPATLEIKQRYLAPPLYSGYLPRKFSASPNCPYLIYSIKSALGVIDLRSGKGVRRAYPIRKRSHTTRLYSVSIALDGRWALEPRSACLFQLEGPDLIFQRKAGPTIVEHGRKITLEWTAPDIFDRDESEILLKFRGDGVILQRSRLSWLHRAGGPKMNSSAEPSPEAPSEGFRKPRLEHLQVKTPSAECVAVMDGASQRIVFVTADRQIAAEYRVPRGCGTVVRRGRTVLFAPYEYAQLVGHGLYATRLPETFAPAGER